MPRQHPRVLPRPPWRSRLAGWLRGFAESLDPAPDGLDLTGAPDFWAEHVRAAARSARKNGRVFRMRRWGVGERPGPGAPHAEGRGDERSRPPGPHASGARSTPAPPTAARIVSDPVVPDSGHPGAEAATGYPPPAGQWQDPAAARADRPLVRPRHATPRSARQPVSSAPAHPESAVPGPGSGRVGPPMVRPRNPAASRPAAVAPPPLTTAPTPPRTTTPPGPGDAAPPWPRLAPSAVPPPHPGTQDWFSPPDVAPADVASGWPDRPALTPRPEAPPSARVRVTEPGEGRDAQRVAVPRWREPRQPEPAVLPESLWPDLPVRRPPAPVMPDPAPGLLRRERLSAEQAAT